MALVAYDYDSTSEEEDNSTPPHTTQQQTQVKSANKEQEDKTLDNEHKILEGPLDIPTANKLFINLPQTKGVLHTAPDPITNDKLEDFIPKYQPPVKSKMTPQKVKITIPLLSQFKDEDEPNEKKIKVSTKSTGLLSLLPPVKGTPTTIRSFVPNVLNKPTSKKDNSSLVPHAVRKKAEETKKASLQKAMKIPSNDIKDSDDDDDDVEIPETFDEDMWNKACGRSKPKEKIVQEHPEEAPQYESFVNIAPEPEEPYQGLDNMAFKELVGKSKRPINIKLIDINEEEILPEKDVWLRRSLTEPDSAPKKVIENPVDPTRRKKHHITYLAEQAKANEQELQSQWAAGKFNRNQTRSKYGF